MGASAANITNLLATNFIKLVLVAFLIAVPVAWIAMNKWLENFAYRINISWMVFIIAGLAVMIITFLTISFQSVKAALANPVKSLRRE